MAMNIVKTEQGLVEGLPCGNPCYTSFKGIPYCAPPTGKNRWRAPQPAEHWDGVRKAYVFGPQCLQFPFPFPRTIDPCHDFDMAQSEDCLTLNIWTPASSQDAKLPVMFWIHGGGFVLGGGSDLYYDGEVFCKEHCVFVSINYRLGVFGFFNHPELAGEDPETASGSFGTLDQQAALKWVKGNIAAFGGDPDNITVFGQSAGAMSVQLMVSSPLSRNLISKAILQSGIGLPSIPLVPAPSIEEARNYGAAFMKKAGVDSLGELRNVNSEKILQLFKEMPSQLVGVVDGYVLKEDSFISLIKGHSSDIPYLCGSNEDEGRLPDDENTRENMRQVISQRMGDRAEELLSICGDNLPNLILLGTFLQSERIFGNAQTKNGRKAPYIYHFTRNVPSYPEFTDLSRRGSVHSAEVSYVFQTLNRFYRPMTGIDYDLAMKMTAYWANFAKTGNPNGPGLPQWKPYTPNAPQFMELGDVVRMIDIEESPSDRLIREYTEEKLFIV